MKYAKRFSLEEFKKYNIAIYNNEIDMTEKSKNAKNSADSGYLIRLDDLEEIKEYIKYKECKKLIESNDENSDNWSKIFRDIDNSKIKKISQVTPLISEYIKNSLLNNNKFILISPELFEIISDKKDIPISFQINRNQITLNLDEELNLQNKNFIFDKNSIRGYNNNLSEILDIYKSVSKYYFFEKNFENELKDSESKSKTGYLISNSWFQKWKKYSNYEDLKNYFKDKQNENEITEEDKHEIVNNIIRYRAINNKLYSKPDELDIIYLKEPNQFKSTLEKDNAIIIDNPRQKFLSIFIQFLPKETGKAINYSIKKNSIKIEMDEPLFFKADNNILSFKNIISDEIFILMQMIKIFCFQEEIQQLINYEYNNNKNIQNQYDIYLINNNIIRTFKENFGYKKLYDYLKANKYILNELIEKKENIIRYELLTDDILNKIISSLKNKIPDFKDFKKYEKDIYENVDKKFNIKTMSNNKVKNMKYIDDFEIINEDILNYFIEKKIVTKNDVCKGEYVIGSGQIFLFFNYNWSNFHEIGYLSSSQEFKIKYIIIETHPNKNNTFINQIKNYGLKNLLDLKYNNENDSGIWIKDIRLGNMYPINENDDINNKEENNINESKEDISFNNIILLLIKFISFNKTIIDKYNLPKPTRHYYYQRKIFNIDGYLINKKFINELEKLVPFDKIIQCFDTFSKKIELNQKDEKDILSQIIKEKNIYFHSYLHCKKKIQN